MTDTVRAPAGSIQLPGKLVPLVVREADHGFELVAGLSPRRRVALDRPGRRAVVVRDPDTEDADRGVESITRKQLNP